MQAVQQHALLHLDFHRSPLTKRDARSHTVLVVSGHNGPACTYLPAVAFEMWNHLRSDKAKPAAAACMPRKLICIWQSRAMFPAVTRRFFDAMDGTDMLRIHPNRHLWHLSISHAWAEQHKVWLHLINHLKSVHSKVSVRVLCVN